jgi:hypothetical protein
MARRGGVHGESSETTYRGKNSSRPMGCGEKRAGTSLCRLRVETATRLRVTPCGGALLTTTQRQGAYSEVPCWYQYDVMSRMVIVEGVIDAARQITLGLENDAAKGVGISYDSLGRRVAEQVRGGVVTEYFENNMWNGNEDVTRFFVYNDVGNRTAVHEFKLAVLTSPNVLFPRFKPTYGGVRESSRYDDVGRLPGKVEFKSDCVTVLSNDEYVYANGQLSEQRSHDQYGRLASRTFFGEPGMRDGVGG